MTLEEIFDMLDADRGRHMMADAATLGDLDHLETVLGRRVPRKLRAFLERFGGGIFYERHEIFGCRRLMIHDIEMVPDLLTMSRRLEESDGLPSDLLPFHRADGVVHLMDLRVGAAESPVLSWKGSATYPDLAAFLEAVVVPSRLNPSPS